MNKIFKSLIAGAVILPSVALTGCIEETFPTQSVTQDQLVNSPSAAESLAMGMPAFLNTVFTVPGNRHSDFGYPSQMIIRDVMTADYCHAYSGYDHFTSWSNNQSLGKDYIIAQQVWWYYSKLLQSANLAVAAVDPETTNLRSQHLLGCAHAFRAMTYLDMGRLYEFLPNDKTVGTVAGNEYVDAKDVTGYTVPIVTASMTEAQARCNPRVTHAVLSAEILGDLDAAEKYIVASARTSKTMPDLACVYGLKARLYMWDENYPKAREYARKAIDTFAGSPTTAEQWLDKATGFNTLSTPSWMWGGQYVTEDDAVQTSIINWTSWISNEFVSGYVSAGPYVQIGAELYNKINDADFRKLTFVAPEGSPLAGQENWIDQNKLVNEYGVELPAYASLKFKPNKANMESSDEGCASAYPLMRIEEMYLIEAEAAAQTAPAEGKALLENFMKTYRYSTYSFEGTSKEQVVDEIFLQKRIELFGEGLIFFDYKRLNKSVIRYYEGSNFSTDRQFNTNGRPAWMNFVFVDQEAQGNKAFENFNNPDPSLLYDLPTPSN